MATNAMDLFCIPVDLEAKVIEVDQVPSGDYQTLQ